MMFLICRTHEAQLISWALSLDSAKSQMCSQFNMPVISMYPISKQRCLRVLLTGAVGTSFSLLCLCVLSHTSSCICHDNLVTCIFIVAYE